MCQEQGVRNNWSEMAVDQLKVTAGVTVVKSATILLRNTQQFCG